MATTQFDAPPRGGHASRRALVSSALAIAYLMVTAASVQSVDGFIAAPAAATVLLASGLVAIPFRVRVPVLAFAVTVGGALGVSLSGMPVVPLALLVIVSVVVVRGEHAGWVAGAAGACVLLLACVFHTGHVVGGVIPSVVILVGILLGVTVRSRRRTVQTLRELAESLRNEQDQRAVVAVADERARISRDMHDVVAHGLSVMIRLADGTEAVALRDPAAAQTSAATIASVGRGSLADLRRVLNVIGGDRQAVGDVRDIRSVVAEHRAAGLPVVIERLELQSELDGVATVVCRIVQECLTNAARYANGASRVTVDVQQRTDTIRIQVEDDGPATPGGMGAESVGSERGLLGIRERAALYAGTVDAGPVTPHGWRVIVVLRPGASA